MTIGDRRYDPTGAIRDSKGRSLKEVAEAMKPFVRRKAGGSFVAPRDEMLQILIDQALAAEARGE